MRLYVDEGGLIPTRAHETDAGLDLYSPISTKIGAHKFRKIDTGVHVELPQGTCGLVKSKSGLMSKYGIVTDGVVDEGYTGSIGVVLFNHGDQDYYVKARDRIAQLLVVPVTYAKLKVVDALDETERGNDGFGSTGR